LEDCALDCLMKVMSNNVSTGFMEDYTYKLTEENEYILQSHMLEVDSTIAKKTLELSSTIRNG